MPHPTLGNGKICYLEIPATDIERSSTFYKNAFGWLTRKRSDGEIAFDDSVGEVSGTWTTKRKPNSTLGILLYIMVDDIHKTIALIEKHGGKIVQAVGMDAPEITAHFADPDGNIFGLYQEPKQ